MIVVDIGGPVEPGYYSDSTGPTASATRIRNSPNSTRCCSALRPQPWRRCARRHGGGGRRRGSTCAGGGGVLPTTSFTEPAMASDCRCTRSPTSWRVTAFRWPRAWRSASSPATCRADGESARIEDIVIVTEDGALSVNNRPRELAVVPLPG